MRCKRDKKQPCNTIQDRTSCLTSIESRAGIFQGQDCVWCQNGPCTNRWPNRCEPKTFLQERNATFEECLKGKIQRQSFYLLILELNRVDNSEHCVILRKVNTCIPGDGYDYQELKLGEVATEGGNLVRKIKGVWSVNECTNYCDETRDCYSFIHCRSSANVPGCDLKDKKLDGSEPTTILSHCTTYYLTFKGNDSDTTTRILTISDHS